MITDFYASLERARSWMYTAAETVPLAELDQWRYDPEPGVIRHASGKFYTIEGIDVTTSAGRVRHWSQPIISQPEVGILGILVKRFDGVPHYLMQFKAEPGNQNGIQLSPTVQATRSNYTRVHGGSAVPYLDYFRDRAAHRVVYDSRQSEQGCWFLRKRNRNMIIEVAGEVEVLDGFHWLTLPELHELLAVEDLVNMDARSVLSCLPCDDVVAAAAGLDGALDGDEFRLALVRSLSGARPGLHGTDELLSWITDVRTHTDLELRRVPLDRLSGWRYGRDRIVHETGRFFEVIGVRVEAGGREVGRWDQPMIAAGHPGLIAFLVTRIGGVLHVLTQLRVEPGYSDVAELAPTVQCTPANYASGDLEPPAFLDEVLHADRDRIRFDTVLSEEGGRFFQTRNRYLVVETARRFEHPGFRWMTLRQLAGLLRHSHYVNVQARTLVACLGSLVTPSPVPVGGTLH